MAASSLAHSSTVTSRPTRLRCPRQQEEFGGGNGKNFSILKVWFLCLKKGSLRLSLLALGIPRAPPTTTTSGGQSGPAEEVEGREEKLEAPVLGQPWWEGAAFQGPLACEE